MADEPISGAAAPVSPAPAAAAPASAPAAAPTPAPAAAAEAPKAPESAPAAAAEAPKAPDAVAEALAPKAAADEPTLLETIGLKDEKKPAEGEKPPEKVETPPDQPEKFTFQPFTPPEGVKLDVKRVTALDDVINERLPPQEQRDKLINMHIDEMKNYDTRVRQEQQDTFRDTRKNWLQEIKADPELGGSGFDTTKTNVAEMRDLFVSSHKANSEGYIADMAEFNHMLRYTGVGDHPAFWRFLNNVARKFKEPAAPSTEIKPPPDLGNRPGTRGRRSSLYDHPTSNQNRNR